jgi:NADH-quinone oxidoreductase subunit M
VILGAVYMLWMYQRVFLGPPRKAASHGMPDLTLREWFTVAPLLAAIIVIGFYPQPLLSAMKDPVDAFVQRLAPAARGGRRAAIDPPPGRPVAPREAAR